MSDVKKSEWKPFDADCEGCGGKAEVFTSEDDGYVYDGDAARCAHCLLPGCAIVDDAIARIQWSQDDNDIERATQLAEAKEQRDEWLTKAVDRDNRIAELERKLSICLRTLDTLRRDSKSPDFVKVYCALIEDELAGKEATK